MKPSVPTFGLLFVLAALCQGSPTCPSPEILVVTKEDVREEVLQELSFRYTFEQNYTLIRSDIQLLLQQEIARQIEPVATQIDAMNRRGESRCNPAVSCKEILENKPGSPSGNYWIEDRDGNPVRKHCDMTRTCGGITGGWTKVVTLDMRNDSSECPSGLREREHPDHKLCGKNIRGSGCSSANFAVDGIQYNRVCGKIIAYQFGPTDSFGLHPPNQVKSIDQDYLDGISLTHGQNSRKHVWSFASALDEVPSCPYCNCQCTHNGTSDQATPSRSFVGNDYFCDTGSAGPWMGSHLYVDNPLFDGASCGPDNTCCSFNNPPWFFKQLPSSTRDDIELRVCSNQDPSDEEVRIEQIELYVQ